jgi:hypothetical protein
MKKILSLVGLCSIMLFAAGVSAAETWSGGYVGLQYGIARTNTEIGDMDDDTDNQEMNGLTDEGGAFGLYTGYSKQKGSFVYGVEAGWTEMNNSNNSTLGGSDDGYLMSTYIDNALSLKARFGLAVDNSLIYMAAGPVWSKLNFHYAGWSNEYSTDATIQGLAYAIGLETQFTGHLVGRFQSEWINLRDFVIDDTENDVPFRNTTSAMSLSAGLAYKF